MPFSWTALTYDAYSKLETCILVYECISFGERLIDLQAFCKPNRPDTNFVVVQTAKPVAQHKFHYIPSMFDDLDDFFEFSGCNTEWSPDPNHQVYVSAKGKDLLPIVQKLEADGRIRFLERCDVTKLIDRLEHERLFRQAEQHVGEWSRLIPPDQLHSEAQRIVKTLEVVTIEDDGTAYKIRTKRLYIKKREET